MNEVMKIKVARDARQEAEEIAIQEKHEELMTYEASKAVPFVTAVWASLGVSVIVGSVVDVSPITAETLPVLVPFVVGVYLSSYIGGRLLTYKRVRENVFLSVGVSFLVAEGVLLSGTILGSLGHMIREMLIEGVNHVDYQELLTIPLMVVFFGAMFCLPLAVGLGAHVRLWSWWKARALQREAVSAPELSVPSLFPQHE